MLEVGGKGKIIANLSFGLPPFGRVPGFGLRIANLEARRQKKLKAEGGNRRSRRNRKKRRNHKKLRT